MNLRETYEFLIGDFQDVWEAVADDMGDFHRGNYLFACQIATLWRFAEGLTVKDTHAAALWSALHKIDPRYTSEVFQRVFIYLSDPLRVYEQQKMEMRHGDPRGLWIARVVDECRGLAWNARFIDISLTGADYNRGLNLPSRTRPETHLSFENATLYIRTDQLFLDVKKAIEDSGILEGLDA